MTAPHPCATPISWADLVDYWAADVEPARADGLDEHLMSCGSCSALSARVSAVTDALRAIVPPFIDHARLATLHERGFSIVDNLLAPDERREVKFAATTDFLVHRLAGLDLSDVDRVSVTISVEETGDVLLAAPSVPFDRDSGEILIACQRHFVAFPPNIVAEVRAHATSGAERIARYPIPHVFERRPGEPT